MEKFIKSINNKTYQGIWFLKKYYLTPERVLKKEINEYMTKNNKKNFIEIYNYLSNIADKIYEEENKEKRKGRKSKFTKNIHSLYKFKHFLYKELLKLYQLILAFSFPNNPEILKISRILKNFFDNFDYEKGKPIFRNSPLLAIYKELNNLKISFFLKTSSIKKIFNSMLFII